LQLLSHITCHTNAVIDVLLINQTFMRKTFLTSLITFLFINAAFSQTEPYKQQKFMFGFGGALLFPAGNFRTTSGFGMGVEATGVYNFSKKLSGFMQVGSDFITVIDTDEFKGSAFQLKYHMPFIAGMRFKMNKFFAGAGIGYGLFTDGDGPTGGFLFSPQIGYQLNKHYHFIFHYTSTSVDGSNRAYFGIKAFHTF
jgi:hypothetical protein